MSIWKRLQALENTVFASINCDMFGVSRSRGTTIGNEQLHDDIVTLQREVKELRGLLACHKIKDRRAVLADGLRLPDRRNT